MFVTLLLICLPGQLALQCYYCDTINNVSCPAGDRHIHTDWLQGILTDMRYLKVLQIFPCSQVKYSEPRWTLPSGRATCWVSTPIV